MPHREPFDPKRALVAARDFTFAGIPYNPGDPFPEPGVDVSTFSRRLIERQYDTFAVNHVPEEVEAEGTVQMVPGPNNGRYTITAPWLDEPLIVRGKKNADEEFAKIKEEGPPLGWIEGGTETGVEHVGGGWFAITAPWLDEPEKVQGREAAEARQREIHAAGAPDPELEPVEGHAASVLIAIEDDKFVVTAPWLEAPEEFADSAAAEARQGELRAEGPPEGWEPPEDGADENPANAGAEEGADKGADDKSGTDDAEKDEGTEGAGKAADDADAEKEAGKANDAPAAT